ATETHRLVRMLRCVRGDMRFAVDLAPRFDYGRAPHVLEPTENGAVFNSPDLSLMVHESEADGPPREIRVAECERLLTETVAFWHSWLARCTYTGRWRETVHRS